LENCKILPTANIPIITFNFVDDGQEIDISLAILDQDNIPEDIETNIEKHDDKLNKLEEKSLKSLNGRRDNSFILNNCGARKDVFKDAVKYIK
jgi:poly(A) polymerase Pap1